MDIPARAKAYADADFADVNDAFVERLIELADESKMLRVLDLGTGPGDIPLLIGKFRPAWDIVAVDGSTTMLEHAKRSVGPETHLVRADAQRTPFAKNAFDIVYSTSMLHHLADPASFWLELGRVAKPAALIFVRDLLRPEGEETAREIVETYSGDEHAYLKEDFYCSLLAAYTLEEVTQQLHAAGFEDFIVEQVTDRHLDVIYRL